MSLIDRIKVLVLHDDPIAQEGLSAAFRRNPLFELQEKYDAQDGVVRLFGRSAHRSVDVVVANYQQGVAIAAEAKRQNGIGAAPRVAVVAGINREWEIRNALECGVRGYILSGCALDELIEGVREVLGLVVDGLCNKSIAKKLGIAEGTVKSHLKATFNKLSVQSRTQAIAVVERRGLFRQYGPADFAVISGSAKKAGSLIEHSPGCW
jgi:DNA-binding NarL/FixJ family response regulator